MDDFLTTKQVIELLKIDRTTLYRMLREERIRGIKVGSQWRFQKSEIDSLLHPCLEQDPQNIATAATVLPLHCLQPIQEVFSDMIQVAAITTDADGEPLSKYSNPCKFCEMILSSDKGKAACIKSWKEVEFGSNDKTTFAICHARLNFAGANIILDGKKIARLFAGQFYCEKPNPHEEEKHIKKLAGDFDLDEEKLMKAASDIALIDERVALFLGKWLQKVAKSFATLALERRELMNRLKNIAEISKF